MNSPAPSYSRIIAKQWESMKEKCFLHWIAAQIVTIPVAFVHTMWKRSQSRHNKHTISRNGLLFASNVIWDKYQIEWEL